MVWLQSDLRRLCELSWNVSVGCTVETVNEEIKCVTVITIVCVHRSVFFFKTSLLAMAKQPFQPERDVVLWCKLRRSETYLGY